MLLDGVCELVGADYRGQRSTGPRRRSPARRRKRHIPPIPLVRRVRAGDLQTISNAGCDSDRRSRRPLASNPNRGFDGFLKLPHIQAYRTSGTIVAVLVERTVELIPETPGATFGWERAFRGDFGFLGDAARK